MTLPGFTAKASLYRSANSYRQSWRQNPSLGRNAVIPTAMSEDLRNFLEGGGGFTGSGGFGGSAGGGRGGGGGGGADVTSPWGSSAEERGPGGTWGPPDRPDVDWGPYARESLEGKEPDGPRPFLTCEERCTSAYDYWTDRCGEMPTAGRRAICYGTAAGAYGICLKRCVGKAWS